MSVSARFFRVHRWLPFLVSLAACGDNMTLVQALWNATEQTMVARTDELARALPALDQRAARIQVDPADAEGLKLKEASDARLKSMHVGLEKLTTLVKDLRPKVAEALKGGRVGGVQIVIDNGSGDFDKIARKLDPSKVSATLDALEAHVDAFAKQKVAVDAAPVANTRLLGDVDYYYVDFAAGSDTLTLESASAKANVAAMVAMLNACPGLAVEVQAHTDKQGDAKASKALSLKRAQALVKYLVSEAKVPSAKLKRAVGLGSEVPAMEEPLPDSADAKAMDAAKLALIRDHNERIRLKILTPCK